MNQHVKSDTLGEEQLLNLCKEAVGSQEIFAACFYGPRVYGYGDEKADVNIMLILPNYAPKIRNLTKKTNNANLSILAVDRKIFENDVEKGRFGEFTAEIITLPYLPWMNPPYLEGMEVKMKKRFVQELLGNLILRYPELSMELLIKPEYFMYEVMRRRARLFQPLMNAYLNMFKGKTREQNVNSIMRGYRTALEELEKENCIKFSDDYVKISKDFVEATKRRRTRVSNLLMPIQKNLLPYFQDISIKTTIAFLQYARSFNKSPDHKAEKELLKRLEESEKDLLMPTPLGPAPLSDKTSIQDFVRKTVPGGEGLKITVEELGGVLNSVFLLRLQKNHTIQKIVVKMFEDWLGFKWFPLALWALGTQSFAVLGKTRLEREYSINQFLSKNGFAVPRILYVSLKERLIFEEFVDGKKASETVKQIIVSSSKDGEMRDGEIVKAVGREIARAHQVGISLGDCKPENILLTKDGRVCFLDLEQATRDGNQPWDIAEFLYYSGHYFLPTHSDAAAKLIASSFIEGYLEAGGKRENVRKAAFTKYTKVFSIFTLPHIILTMANTCKKMGEEH